MNAKTTYATGMMVLLASCHLLAQETAAQRHEMATDQLQRLAGHWLIYFTRTTILPVTCPLSCKR